MATANEVLEQMEQHPELYVSADVCIVDPVTRTISVPDAYRILGVESDESVKIVPFQCPKMVEDDVDLTDFTLYINYVNAGGDFDMYSIENVKESGENITFDWIIRRSVTARRGTIRFILCAKRSDDEGNIIQEWNTTINDECESLEGLEGAPSIADQYPDIIQQILEKLQEITGGGGGTGGPVDQEQIQQAVNDYLTKNPPSGMTTEQQQQLTKNTNDITDLKSEIGNLDLLETANNGDLVSAINEANQNSSGILTDEIKQALLQIASKAAYIDADGQFYYDDLYYTLYPEIERPFKGSMYITIANETLKEGYIDDDGGLISNANSHLIDRTVRALPFALADNGILLGGTTLRSAYYDSEQRFLGRDYAYVQENQPIKLVNNDYAVYEKVGWEGALNVSYVILLSEMNDSLFTNTNVSIDASGDLSSETQFQATDLIRIPNDCNKYVLLSANITQVNKIAFYNSSKTFISREYTGMNVNNLSKYGDIPTNAVYYRMSKRENSIMYNAVMKET